jgi:hypothetical protein
MITEIATVSLTSFSMVLIGLSLGFLLIKVESNL